MAKEFQELELLVARIQQQLAPNADITHNVRRMGQHSKRMRQIDVLVEQKVGQYDITIVIDCKDYSKPVNVKGVEEFIGLVEDIGAMKGVLVCPKGFTQAAKNRAVGKQVELYSPVDTDPHKWQVGVTVPALCDFRTARISFGIVFSQPLPFRMPLDFHSTSIVYSEDGSALGTPLQIATAQWNEGLYPSEPGERDRVAILPQPIKMDNGHGMIVPIEVSVGLLVEQELFYGDYPIRQMSGFKDEIRGGVITNAFQVGLLDPAVVYEQWKRIESVDKAPERPVITLSGLVAWGD